MLPTNVPFYSEWDASASHLLRLIDRPHSSHDLITERHIDGKNGTQTAPPTRPEFSAPPDNSMMSMTLVEMSETLPSEELSEEPSAEPSEEPSEQQPGQQSEQQSEQNIEDNIEDIEDNIADIAADYLKEAREK